MKLVLVITKMTGNTENDRQRAAEYCRYAAYKGVIPVSAYLNFYGMFEEKLGGALERLMISQTARKADEIWVFGNEKQLEEACFEYGNKAKYFDTAVIGEELLISAMYNEELLERLQKMEGL